MELIYSLFKVCSILVFSKHIQIFELELSAFIFNINLVIVKLNGQVLSPQISWKLEKEHSLKEGEQIEAYKELTENKQKGVLPGTSCCKCQICY